MTAPATLVLIHGFPLDSRMWARQGAALEAAGYRVLTPDLPGFGQSAPWPRQHCSLDAFADEIHRCLEAYAGGPAVVGGLSMGGYVLLALLRRHRQAVRAAIFMDTHPAADTPSSRQKRWQLIDAVAAQGVRAVAEAMLPRLLSATAGAEVRQAAMALMLAQDPQGVIGALEAMARRPDQTDLLPTLSLPVLLIAGEQDASTPPAVMAAMRDKIPGSRLVEIPRAGHLSNLEAPEEVNAALLHFLHELPTSSGAE